MVDQTTTMEVKNEYFCRTCSVKDVLLSSVFEIYADDIRYDYIIKDITEVKITADSYLPTMICQDCKQKAINAFEFKRKTKNVDLFLRSEMHNENILFSSDKNVKLEQQTSSGLSSSDFELLLPVDDKAIEIFRDEFGNKDEPELKYETDESNSANNFLAEILKNDNNEGRDIATQMKPTTKKRNTVSKVIKLNALAPTFPIATSYSCSFCNQQFGNKNTLNEHVYEHKNMKIIHCLVCKKIYLKTIKFEHDCPNKKDVYGEVAKNVYNSTTSELPLLNIIETLPLENLDVIKVCCVCSELFLSEEELEKHNDTHHPELSLRCGQCQKVFATIKTAARHRKNCKQTEKKFTCKTCGQKFAYEISLNKHILKYHEGQSVSVKFMDTKSKFDKQFQCDTCNKTFKRRDLLVKHTKIHMPNEKNFECDVCMKRFNRKDNLRSHKRVHELHSGKSSGNCLCLYCGRSFTNSSNLIVHMRRHTGEKPYKCDYCGKGFPRSSDLKWHRVSHTGEKPCVCRICNKRFARSNKLSRHMRVHSGYKPYKCTYCEKAFAQSYDLTLHIRRHTGDKPYICEVCGDRFIQGNALQNHRRVHGHFPSGEQDIVNPAPNTMTQAHDVTYTVETIIS